LLAEMSEWADAARPAGLPASRTCRYGDDPSHEADLLLPDRAGPHPLAVLLHGGFWRARFTRSLMSALAVDLAVRGWASWNLEYRRVGCGGGVPATLDDVHAGIDALSQVDAPLDLTRVVLIGHSAGGQLALAVASRTVASAVVSLAGVCDLESGARDLIGDRAVVEFMGGAPAQRPDAYALADPLRLLPSGVRVLLIHGDADDRVPVAQSRDYARAAVAAGDRCQLLELAGVEHFAVIDPRTAAWAAVVARLEGLVT
jgi:acetyl esterase/lipase